MKAKSIKIKAVLVLLILSSIVQAENLQIQFTNIRSTKGQLLIAVFKNQADFDAQKPSNGLKVKKSGIENGIFSVDIVVEPGTYGISVIDDENNNSNIDTNFLGIPVEGFGFSRITRILFGKPKFKDFSFTMLQGVDKVENVYIRYFF